MLNYKNIFLLFAFLMISSAAFSQKKYHDVEEKELKLQLKTADKLLALHSYYNAIPLYKEVLSASPQSIYTQFKLATAYFMARDYKTSKALFQKVLALKKAQDYDMAFYYYGESLRCLGEYEQAVEIFLTFMRIRSRDREIKIHKSLTMKKLKSCEFAIETIQNEDWPEEEVETLKGKLNRAYAEFSPMPIREDSLLFAALASDTVVSVNYTEPELPTVKFFVSQKVDKEWSKPEEVTKFNSPFAHSANGVLSPDGKKFYFTRCQPNRKEEIQCAIYVSKLMEKGWSKPVKLDKRINLKGTSSTQPTFGNFVTKRKTFEVLYFVSDRRGGKGGKDIWFSIMDDDGNFKPVRNCGARINTAGDEVSPFYDNENKMMYFSSNYHFNFGGFDVFKSEGWTNRWAAAKNMGRPLNSSFDDTYYVPAKNFQTGFIVSNREGSKALIGENCCEDIFAYKKIDVPVLKFDGLIAHNEDTITNLLSDVMIGYIPKEELSKVDPNRIESYKDKITWVSASDTAGLFTFNQPLSKRNILVFHKLNFVPKIISIDSIWTLEDKNIALNLKMVPDSLKVDVDISTKEVISQEKREDLSTENAEADELEEGRIFVLNNLYFDTNQDELKKEFYPQLNLLLQFLRTKPEVKVEVSGHSDNVGAHAHNIALSQRRADKVREYLLKNGIDKTRVISKGYGPMFPIAPNQHPDGTDDLEGRRKNRRTEVKILEIEEINTN